MKKIFLPLFLILVLSFSTTFASQKQLVQISNLGAERLLSSMRDGQLGATFRKEYNLLLTNLRRLEKFDNATLNQSAWLSAYGIRGNEHPSGAIVFFVNSRGYVDQVKLEAYDNLMEPTGCVLIMLLASLNLTQNEIEIFLDNMKKNSVAADLWCPSINKRLNVISNEKAILFFATDS